MSFSAFMGLVSLAFTAGSLIYGIIKGSPSSSMTQQAASSLNTPTSSYGMVMPLVFGRNRLSLMIIWYDDFASVAHSQTTTQTGGKGGLLGGGASQTTTTFPYTVSFLGALAEGPISYIHRVYDNTRESTGEGDPGFPDTGIPAGGSGYDWVLYDGDYDQTPWPYLESNHPTKALAYRGIALIPRATYDLGETPALPPFSFEVSTPLVTGIDQKDANPAEIVSSIVTNSNYGLGRSDILDTSSLNDWKNYCLAMDFLMSPVLNDSKAFRETLLAWLQLTNTEATFSQGKVIFRPLGDSTVSGNDTTWVPNLDPVAALSVDDFVAKSGDAPIVVEYSQTSDIKNIIDLEIKDRANDYQKTVVSASDQAHVFLRGESRVKITAHEICEQSIARRMAQIILQRHLFRPNKCKFTLGWEWLRLEPLDIITIPGELLIGSSSTPQKVRIIEKTEDADGLLQFVAEPIIEGIYNAPDYPYEAADRYKPYSNEGASAGSVTGIVIFAPPLSLSVDQELWIGACGGGNWGGCQIWISDTGDDYKKVGEFAGMARMGVLTADLPASTVSPDTTNTLSVDLTMSQGWLGNGDQTAANNLRTLCYVDNEYLAYASAVLTSQYNYDLTYLVRGAYGSDKSMHEAGSSFVRLDDAVYKYAYLSQEIGKGFYLKLLPFNPLGRISKDLEEVEPTYFIMPSPGEAAVTQTFAELSIYDTSGTTIAIESHYAKLENSSGDIYSIFDVDLTMDAATNGLNGLDVGSLAASTLYYLHLVGDKANQLFGCLGSLSKSSPTLPTGYDYTLCVGVFFTDSSAAIKDFAQTDYSWEYGAPEEVSSGTTAQSWTDQDASALMPPDSDVQVGAFDISVNGSSTVTVGLRKDGESGSGEISGTIGPVGNITGYCHVLNGVVELYISDTTNWSLKILGFTLII